LSSRESVRFLKILAGKSKWQLNSSRNMIGNESAMLMSFGNSKLKVVIQFVLKYG
jgi:hypothetical protein